ncbi:MAG: hypothetical protein ABR529_07360 [Actinomycetota bacterium]
MRRSGPTRISIVMAEDISKETFTVGRVQQGKKVPPATSLEPRAETDAAGPARAEPRSRIVEPWVAPDLGGGADGGSI